MSLISAIESLAPTILSELESLVLPIIRSPDPMEQIAKAKRILALDAMDAAADASADAALNAALKRAHSLP